MLTVVKDVGCFQDTVYEDPVHLHKYSKNNSLLFNYLIVLHHVNCV